MYVRALLPDNGIFLFFQSVCREFVWEQRIRPGSLCRASAVCFICLRSLPYVGDSINPFSHHVNRFILSKTSPANDRSANRSPLQYRFVIPFPFYRSSSSRAVQPSGTSCHVASNSPVYHGSATSPGRLVCSISNETLGLRPALFLSGLFQSEPEPMKVKPSFILVHSHITLYHCTFRVGL